jgi:PAS domain S-box-containing protein
LDGIDDGEPVRPDLGALFAAVEASGEAILITSADLDEPGPRIEYVNPAFTRMTGYAAREVVGRTPRLLQGPGTEGAVIERMRAALRAGEGFQGEALNYRKDGSTYMVEWLITPVREDDGRITHWVSAQRDVIDRRAFEDQQAMMVRELYHRVKNTLATVQAVRNATMRSASRFRSSEGRSPVASSRSPGPTPLSRRIRRKSPRSRDCSGPSSIRTTRMGASRLGDRPLCFHPNSQCLLAWHCTSSPPTPAGTEPWRIPTVVSR